MVVNKESCELNEQREQSYACMGYAESRGKKRQSLNKREQSYACMIFAEREQVRAQLNQRIKDSKIQRKSPSASHDEEGEKVLIPIYRLIKPSSSSTSFTLPDGTSSCPMPRS